MNQLYIKTNFNIQAAAARDLSVGHHGEGHHGQHGQGNILVLVIIVRYMYIMNNMDKVIS